MKENEFDGYNMLEQGEVIAEANIFNIDERNFITLEIPGFSKNDIDAYFEEDVLIIEGSRDTLVNVDYQTQNYVVVGNFRNKFQLGKRTEVNKITVKDGICTVELYDIEPEKRTLEVQ